jgi:hypothetical protein
VTTLLVAPGGGEENVQKLLASMSFDPTTDLPMTDEQK